MCLLFGCVNPSPAVWRPCYEAGAMSSLFSVLLFGMVLGLHHALDADHVIAVSTISSREKSLRAAVRLAAFWGVGHALTVLLVGGSIILFGAVVPPRLGLGLEFAVALMLMALGLANLTGGLDRLHRAAHSHAGTAPRPSSRGLLRPLGIGVVHGLAGSAAVALLVLASVQDPVLACVGLGVFVVGTLFGMVLLSAIFATTVAYAARKLERVRFGLARAAGALSFAFGLFLAVRIGFVDGLFL
jgi:high-affinity nickel permease